MSQKVIEKSAINYDRSTSILGCDYQIRFKNYADFPEFKLRGATGLCDMMTKVITICNVDSYPDYIELDSEHLAAIYKEIMRHEIMHAFLYESGLNDESHSIETNWATDEELIDWFAIQAPKIFKVYKELDIL